MQGPTCGRCRKLRRLGMPSVRPAAKDRVRCRPPSLELVAQAKDDGALLPGVRGASLQGNQVEGRLAEVDLRVSLG